MLGAVASMKLVGLMVARNDAWILELSVKAALKWCDSVIVVNAGSKDRTQDVLLHLVKEHSDQLFSVLAPNGDKNSDLMQLALDEARTKGATHIAILSPNEILTSNVICLRDVILTLELSTMVVLPSLFCWKNAQYYRDDTSTWSRIDVPVAFKDSAGISWKGTTDLERAPRGFQWTTLRPVQRSAGGVVNLENVHWQRALAKHCLGEMKEILKRPSWKTPKSVQKIHPLDEVGIRLSKIEDEWYEGYKSLFKLVSTAERSFYEDEVSRVFQEHGQEMFSEIHPPGEVISTIDKILPQIINQLPKKYVAPLKPAVRKYVQENPKPMYSKKAAFPKNTIRWSGHFLDYSGYGKANREIMFRLANTFNIVLDSSELSKEPVLVDERTRARVMSHISSQLPEEVPYIRFFGPRKEDHKGRKTIFTMMETYGTHQDLVALLNRYDDIWVPTAWNRTVFEESGVTSPVHTVPLGINQFIYKPGPRKPLPPLKLITTDLHGTQEVPKGFCFVNTSNPSFRKGIDVVIKAFEDAFHGNPDVSLVLCVSYSSLVHCDPFAMVPGGRDSVKSKVYVLEGKMDEFEMAEMYRSCHAYVTASRGEGWNLPLMEASACGLPVIAPDAFSHKEFLTEDNSFMFSPEGVQSIPDAEKISPWYKDQLFVYYGEKSVAALSKQMATVFEDKVLSDKKAEKLRASILEKYTWDAVAEKAARIILETNP